MSILNTVVSKLPQALKNRVSHVPDPEHDYLWLSSHNKGFFYEVYFLKNEKAMRVRYCTTKGEELKKEVEKYIADNVFEVKNMTLEQGAKNKDNWYWQVKRPAFSTEAANVRWYLKMISALNLYFDGDDE